MFRSKMGLEYFRDERDYSSSLAYIYIEDRVEKHSCNKLSSHGRCQGKKPIELIWQAVSAWGFVIAEVFVEFFIYQSFEPSRCVG